MERLTPEPNPRRKIGADRTIVEAIVYYIPPMPRGGRVEVYVNVETGKFEGFGVEELSAPYDLPIDGDVVAMDGVRRLIR